MKTRIKCPHCEANIPEADRDNQRFEMIKAVASGMSGYPQSVPDNSRDKGQWVAEYIVMLADAILKEMNKQ